MQVISLKECKNCGTIYYGGNITIELTPNMIIEPLFNKVRECPHCPEDSEPRTPGYRQIS